MIVNMKKHPFTAKNTFYFLITVSIGLKNRLISLEFSATMSAKLNIFCGNWYVNYLFTFFTSTPTGKWSAYPPA